MKYCCIGFQNHLELADKKGVSIVVQELAMHEAFFMRFRICDRDSGHEWATEHAPQIRSLILGTEIPILYCPWCGQHLATFYQDTWRALTAKSTPL